MAALGSVMGYAGRRGVSSDLLCPSPVTPATLSSLPSQEIWLLGLTSAFQVPVTISSRKLTAHPVDGLQPWSHLVGPTEKYQSPFIVSDAQQKCCIFHKLSSSGILPLSYLLLWVDCTEVKEQHTDLWDKGRKLILLSEEILNPAYEYCDQMDNDLCEKEEGKEKVK